MFSPPFPTSYRHVVLLSIQIEVDFWGARIVDYGMRPSRTDKRVVAFQVRLTAAERKLLRTRARQHGMSASGYLRYLLLAGTWDEERLTALNRP